MSSSRAILDAETPKGVFRQLPPPSIEKPLPFGEVPEDSWFRIGNIILKRHTVPEHNWPDQTAIVMKELNRRGVVGHVWTFDPRSVVFPTSWDTLHQLRHGKSTLEAEDPKSVLKAATAKGTLGYADKALREIGFTRINDKTWARRDQWDRHYVRLRTPILTTIWWDPEAQEWCRKRELCQRNGHKQIGFDASRRFDGLYPF